MTAKGGRPNEGQLILRKSGYVARVWRLVDGVRVRQVLPLDTHNEAVARLRMRHLLEDNAPGAEATRAKTIRRAWSSVADVWALDLGPLEPPETPGVYALFCIPGFVKIGRAANIARRRLELQIGYPLDLSLIAVLSQDPEDEPEFHARFAKDRVRGEWFALSRDIRLALHDARRRNTLAESVVPEFLGVHP